MRVKSLVGLVVGPVDENRWGQVLMQPAGYGVVEIQNKEGRAQEIGAHLLSSLGAALASGVSSLKALEKIVDDVMGEGVRSIVVFVPLGRIVYVAVGGAGSVYIKRGNQIAVLAQAAGGISGEVREGDTLLLASGGFSQMLSHEDISSFFDHDPPEVVAEKLTIALHEKTGGEGSVALVYQVERFEEDSPPPPPVDPMPIVTRTHIPLNSLRMHIKHLRERPKDFKKLAVITLGTLFLVSVLLGIWKQTAARSNRAALAAVVDAQHAFDEGVALLELNPVKGRQRLTQAKEQLDPFVSSVNPRTKEGRQLTSLYQQIQDYLTQSMQITNAAPALFYDMTLMKKEAAASTFALEGKTIIVLDVPGTTAYRIDTTTKNASIVAGGEALTGATLLTFHGDRIYALTPSGVMEFRVGEKKSSLVIKKDDQWGAIASVAAFGGNLYLLDTQKSRIWKYVAVENAGALNAESLSASPDSIGASESAQPAARSGFSALREYLNPDTLPIFSNATNMSIDGTVWVGSRTGHIFHFVSGREETFTPKGVEPAIGNDTLVYASDETKNVYIFDRQNNRVVVVDRDGTYLSQYQWNESLDVRALAVSEAEHRIFLLVAGKIYSLELKQ